MSVQDTVDAVTAVTQPLAEKLGLEVVDVLYLKEEGRWVIRIYIDKAEGVGIGDCEALAGPLGRILDEKDIIPHAYFFEVSSPGIERPLKKPSDYRRFAGRDIRVVTATPVHGNRKFSGNLIFAGDDVIRLEVKGTEVEIPYLAISKANLVFTR